MRKRSLMIVTERLKQVQMHRMWRCYSAYSWRSLFPLIFSFCCSLSNESEQRCTTLTQDTRQCSGGSYLYLTSLIWQTGAGGSRSLLGMWRMQHRMDLALILKAFSPSLRPSLTSRTTSSGVRSPLGGRGAQRESRQRAQLVTSFPRGSTQTRGFRLRLVVALPGQKVRMQTTNNACFLNYLSSTAAKLQADAHSELEMQW